MPSPREQVCLDTAERLAGAAAGLPGIKAVIGLDGFVDEIIAVVDKRHGLDHYEPVRTIAALGQKIGHAAGESSNYELVVKQSKLGGNGPIMANALACLGLRVTYVGNLGYPDLHPVFREFARRAEVISIAEPGHTDALEFDDGKLLLGKITALADVDWENFIDRVGRDRLMQLMGEAKLIGMVNWTMLPHMSRIWSHLLDEVLPHLRRTARHLFVDLADPEKRTRDDILEALQLLGRFQDHAEVTLGLNLKEAMEVADALELPSPEETEPALEATAAAIRESLEIDCVMVHPRRSAAAATRAETAHFSGPFVQQPQISTGAGDHLNAGFCLGRLLGFRLEESLCAGVAASGYYVRTAQSPTAAQLAEFIKQLPPPEG